ncbi:MAG: hypothetical protein ACR2OJ_12375 [Hyphomicrobiales bacterium]
MDLTLDHLTLEDAHETRLYFAKLHRIFEHLDDVARLKVADHQHLKKELEIVEWYLALLANTFTALSYKYLLAGRVSRNSPNLLSIDRQESGLPVYQELLEMANDALQAEKHLRSLPASKDLKRAMVRHILNEYSAPVDLQFAASQRLYYEYLSDCPLFWAQNDPQAIWLGEVKKRRRLYLIHWASYDSQQNVPTIYMALIEDSGHVALPKDESRWPRVQNHLMAQGISSLNLKTIAEGFDQDFEDLHPKLLRRLHIGPLYSHQFTQHNGPLRDVLADVSGDNDVDWAFAWTDEKLKSSRTKIETAGFFSTIERQVYEANLVSDDDDHKEIGGAVQQRRSLILPQRPFQVMEERDPQGLQDIRKYIVSPNGKIFSYR